MAIISYKLGKCRGCGGENTFGNVDVYETYVYRGCEQCRYNTFVPLPPVKKKILYLDQYFLSEAFRAKDERFVQAGKRIGRLAAKQLLVAPYSTIHEEETHQWVRFAELYPFIKSTARGHHFSPTYDVVRTQLGKAIQAFLRGKEAQYLLEREDALPHEIDVWDGYYWIDVGGYLGDVDLIRVLKAQSVKGLVSLCPDWKSSAWTFEQCLRAEQYALAKNYLDKFLEYLVRVASGDYEALLSSPGMKYLLYHVPTTVPEDERLRKVTDFLFSEHFRSAPINDLTARIYATLRDMVRLGAYPDPEKAEQKLSGFFHDVEHIATYAPYCDAIVVDKAMAEIVNKPTVDLEGRYGTLVFSVTNWSDFLAWLDHLEASMSNDHVAALKEAYPGLV